MCPVWVTKLNKEAVKEVKNGAQIRLHIGYMVYDTGMLIGNEYGIKPGWNPPEYINRISVGLWDPKTKKYLTSVLVRKGV